MQPKDRLREEIESIPDELASEVIDFIIFLKSRYKTEKMESTLIAESSLQKDWLLPEEDREWEDL
jgi:hypothetical protein